MRTHHCNELNNANIGNTVTLIGWVNSNRDHGGVAFIDLRDREGLTQCVFRPEDNAEVAEVAVSDMTIVNKSEVLPFQLDKEINNEDMRLKYRFLDLRRPTMARNMKLRHRITKTTRDVLDENGFPSSSTAI